jgi:hypothetical protein
MGQSVQEEGELKKKSYVIELVFLLNGTAFLKVELLVLVSVLSQS